VKKILHYLHVLRIHCNKYDIAVENRVLRHRDGKPYVYIHYLIPIYHMWDRGYNPVLITINSRVTLNGSILWTWKAINTVSKYYDRKHMCEMVRYLLLGMYGHMSLVEIHHRRIWKYAKLLSRHSRLRRQIQWRIMKATSRIGANK